jgi:CubicO group peptidase (beta-lactamase class C family)
MNCRLTRRRFLTAPAAALALPSALQSAASPTAAEKSAIRVLAEAYLKEQSTPCLSVAFAKESGVIYSEGFGPADDSRAPVTPRHLFRIASVSKPITSATIFTLIEKSHLSLTDRIFGPGALLGEEFGKPPYREYVADIRLVHLLTHTAGGWQNDGDDPMFRHPDMNHRELIAWTIANQPLKNPPGEKYAYSNFGYCIVGRIIEKLTGRPYDAYVREQILRPCGIQDMRISGNTRKERAPNEVTYFDPNRESPYGMNVRRMDSHGGWLASASDLARFALHATGLASPNLIAAASLREMTTASSANAGYAKGWAVNRVPNWWHNGSLPGATSIMVRTASGMCWAGLANARTQKSGGALDELMWKMARSVPVWRA